jgi:hypothetical protein
MKRSLVGLILVGACSPSHPKNPSPPQPAPVTSSTSIPAAEAESAAVEEAEAVPAKKVDAEDVVPAESMGKKKPVHHPLTSVFHPKKPRKAAHPLVTKQAEKSFQLSIHAYDTASHHHGIGGVLVKVNGTLVGKTDAKGIYAYTYRGARESLLRVRLENPGELPFETQFVAMNDMQLEKLYVAKGAQHGGTLVSYEESTQKAHVKAPFALKVGETLPIFGLRSDEVGRHKKYEKVATWTAESLTADGGMGKITELQPMAYLQAGDVIANPSADAAIWK